MLPTIHPRKQFHRRRTPRDTAAPPVPPPPPAGVTVTAVFRLGGGRYEWAFSSAFDAADWETWTGAQLAGLRVGGLNPAAVEEAKGAAGRLTLLYGPVGNNLFAVTDAPALLAFDVGQPLVVPQAGTVSG